MVGIKNKSGKYKRTKEHSNNISKSLKGHKTSKKTKQKIGLANSKPYHFDCDYCGKKSRTKKSAFDKKKRHFCSQNCYNKFRSEVMPEYEQPAWKGGISNINQRGRGSRRYRNWMEQVIERFSGECYLCGEEAEVCHHKKSWIDFPGERYNVENGVALCKNCHKEVHQNPELLK